MYVFLLEYNDFFFFSLRLEANSWALWLEIKGHSGQAQYGDLWVR